MEYLIFKTLTLAVTASITRTQLRGQVIMGSFTSASTGIEGVTALTSDDRLIATNKNWTITG